MKRKVIGVLLAILLIVVMGGVAVGGYIMHRNSESEEKLDYEKTYGISDNQYTITFNNELKDYKAIEMDGTVYLSLEGVIADINSRFYWDSNESLLIYTKPLYSVKVRPDENAYDNGGEVQNVDYTPVKLVDGQPYIASEYVKLFTKCDINTYTKPNRLVIRTNWDEAAMVTIQKDTSIRYRGGVKAEILRAAAAGEQLYVLDDSYDDWTMVASNDGYIGWVANKYLTGAKQNVKPQEPEFTPDDYTNIQRDHKIKMVWHQVMTEAANESFDAATEKVSGMNVISPTWFAFQDTEGNIRSILSKDYVDKAHAKGMEVWALFSNQFPNENGELTDFDGVNTDAVLAYTSKRERAVSQIISYVTQNGIDGINLDFEKIMVPEESANAAANYMQFVRELSVACRQNNIVFSIDNYVPMYTKHYDRAEQNVFADYLVIMGYDEYTNGSASAGPVASISFVEQGIKDTLVNVPKEKIINGIPLYTRYWYNDGTVLKCDAVGMSTAVGFAASHGIEIGDATYDAELGLNYISYVGSDGNTYEMWLEDTTAVANKMKLITQYDLAGVSCWKLGQEEGIDIWSIINQYLP